MLLGFLFEMDSPKEVVIVGSSKKNESNDFLDAVVHHYEPSKVILFKDTSNKKSILASIAPWTKAQTTLDGNITAYICEDFACKLPTNNLSVTLKLLNNRSEIIFST